MTHQGILITDLEQLVDHIFGQFHSHNCVACGQPFTCYEPGQYCGISLNFEDKESLCLECRAKFDDGEIEL